MAQRGARSVRIQAGRKSHENTNTVWGKDKTLLLFFVIVHPHHHHSTTRLTYTRALPWGGHSHMVHALPTAPICEPPGKISTQRKHTRFHSRRDSEHSCTHAITHAARHPATDSTKPPTTVTCHLGSATATNAFQQQHPPAAPSASYAFLPASHSGSRRCCLQAQRRCALTPPPLTVARRVAYYL